MIVSSSDSIVRSIRAVCKPLQDTEQKSHVKVEMWVNY